VLGLVLLLVLTWFVLSVLLAAWTLGFQGYLYTEPTRGVAWRAPAAGAALTAFLGLWAALDYRAPGRYRELQGFSTTEDLEPFPELRVTNRDGKEEVFKLRVNSRGQYEYRRNDRPLPTRPAKVVAVRGDQKYVFEAPHDAKGRLKTGPGDLVKYKNADTGWEMDEQRMGYVSVYHPGWLLANLLLNGLHLAVWFLSLWLLLRFQWAHAVGMAIAAWAVMTLFVVPPLLGRAESVSAARNPPSATAPR
jgi:hypothetical protein